MRYYRLELTPPGANENEARVWTSYPNGQYDPNAQDIEFDLLVYDASAVIGLQSVSLMGPALDDLLQSQQFGAIQPPFWKVKLFGGMGAGFPLAKPKQAGLLAEGFVYQAFGNWQGTDMSLDFVIAPLPCSWDQPANIVLNWLPGVPLADALKNCLTTAFPGVPLRINIQNNIVQNFQEAGYYSTLDELAQIVLEITKGWPNGKSDYPGVMIVAQNGEIKIYDSPTAPTPVQIDFTDLIGQPTWIRPKTMLVKLQMRADLRVGSLLRMPKAMQSLPGFVQTMASSYPNFLRYKSTFHGDFLVKGIRHLGSFRSTDATQWATMVECVPAP